MGRRNSDRRPSRATWPAMSDLGSSVYLDREGCGMVNRTESSSQVLNGSCKHVLLDLESTIQMVCIFPQTVWTHLGVLTVSVKQLCLDRCAARACPANSLLFTVHSCLSKSSTCISTTQAREIWVAAASACRDCALVVVLRAFSHMVVFLRGRRKGNLVFWCSKVEFS